MDAFRNSQLQALNSILLPLLRHLKLIYQAHLLVFQRCQFTLSLFDVDLSVFHLLGILLLCFLISLFLFPLIDQNGFFLLLSNLKLLFLILASLISDGLIFHLRE
jgi:hypothetical protein